MNYHNKISLHQVAAIEFEDFDVEPQAQCRYDALTVYNGPDENEPILAKLCGPNIPRDLRGKTNELFVVFTSDHSVQKKGFKARYSAKEPISKFLFRRIFTNMILVFLLFVGRCPG